ncbi:helix-turn-helix transcriptional regulator [Brevundimonas sp. SORGH_AS_0993]|uniref:ArsR/SmtB family transcription factor n=1 Tax=Brevundimonas sp. SORGH_AS_0993 TaxID=3041794 RepID=UPI0027861168|nr:helix-turn-helix domain-containing protein [Brevundimonas sp. SORGH_AS_0993]MDQ1155208.1 putative transcriptional regulator [Brevundimonas sp. SORGH_AS_0993]
MVNFVHPPAESLQLHHVLSALADPVRLNIVQVLHATQGGLNCTAATAPFGQVPKSTLSHHFRVLRESGLVQTTKRGVENINTLRWDDLERRFPGLLSQILQLAPR